MKKYTLYSAGVLVVIGVLFFALGGMGPQTVVAGDNVSVYYTGTLVNGTEFGSNFGQQPLNFTVGSGQVIPGVDNAVLGMHVGEIKNVTIPVNEAYGPINPALVLSAPISAFNNMSLHDGLVVTATGSNGQVQYGTVLGFNSTNVTVDFNNPLAGQTLMFEIKVLKITK